MQASVFLPELRSRYGSLTPAEQRLAEYILQYPSEVLTLTAAALAQRAGTASSAVVRFCKTIGFDGFPAFKLQLAVELSRQETASYVHGVDPQDDCDTVLEKVFSANIRALEDTVSRIDRRSFRELVEALSRANRIYIYGVGTSAGLVSDLEYRLMLLGFQAQGFTDITTMRLSTMNLTAGDLAIGISHSGRTQATVDVLKLAKQNGAETACLTSYIASPAARNADHIITVYSDETQYPIEAVAARIAQAGAIDALVAALAVRHYDKALERGKTLQPLIESVRIQEGRP